MPDDNAFDISRVAVEPDPLLDGAVPDYADCFEVRLSRPDTHSAAEWMRTALEQSPAALRSLIRIVHQHVARFELAPSTDPDRILGWQVAHVESEVLMLEAGGSLLRAALVARRRSPTSATLTTFLFFQRSTTRPMWWAIGPLHRWAAPYLLKRAATELTRTGQSEPVGSLRGNRA